MSIDQPPPASFEADTATDVPFYIPATGPETRPRRTLKHGDSFLVIDAHGDIGATAGAADGLFHCDTRYLSRLEIRANGAEQLLLGSNLRDDNATLTVDLTNPDIFVGKRLVLSKDTVHISRSIFVWRDSVFQRLLLRNHGADTVSLTLTIAFASDFADVFEVRGLRRKRRGSSGARVSAPHEAVLSYLGLDGVARVTSVHFDPAPNHLTQGEATYHVALRPHEASVLSITVRCNPTTPEPVPFLRGLLEAHRELRRAARGTAVVQTSNALFNDMLCRSMADLAMLTTETEQGPYPYAGIPWYSTTFGRDGLITAIEMLWVDPRVARGVLRRLAAFQAHAVSPCSDAGPGKILHEMRAGEMAALGEVPFSRYYGSVDATPLFVLLAGLYFERTADIDTLKELWPAITAALAWIEGPADQDGDGFIEYARANELGLANQGWKDSFDAVFHADGTLADGPIALAEVQGYVFAAKRLAARCAQRLGDVETMRRLEAAALQLAERFEAAFWCEDLQFYAMALDGAKKPCRVRTSNAGQLLFCGIAREDRARIVAHAMLMPDFFSGWGIRTVARSEVRYNPMSYHNGSIWPHDNALIALGLARIGARGALDKLFGGLFDAAGYMDLHRLPELFCGFQLQHGHGPTLYPVACAPQAWASATPFTLLEASLGLQFDPFKGEIRLCNPQLPPFLDEVMLRNLQLGSSSVDLRVRRHGDTVSLDTPRISGDIQVSIVFSS
ncbi:MAG TPA: amylo-alpha-1,6-glucosidase, partial [Paraburkholderia sp.]|nr:amylo-alpha-1,6-glucosidase [Paraburkholderia sp.]